MQQTYTVQTPELESILLERGWLWTNSYYASNHNWSKPPNPRSYTFAEAAHKERLPVEVRPCIKN